jgi:cyclopropane fatty-acyl-phospholipid synthase-like methyltransferase
MTHPPWDDSYRRGTPPWDAGGPRAAVVRLCEQHAFAAPVLDAGCGLGYDALEIASRGLEVVGVDVAPTAIRQAREKAAERGVAATFEVGDALHLERLGRTFRTVLDCGLFHTFGDEDRAAYVESLAAVTAAGSVLHLFCVSDAATGEQGPTRRVGRDELPAAFADGWNVASIEPDHLETTFGGLPAWRARIDRT